MNLLGIIGAVLGGIIGAAIWGLGFGGPGGMESTWFACVVGAITGGGCALFRGRGVGMALLAGLIAVGAVGGGKVFGSWIILNREWSWKDRLAVRHATEQAMPFTDESYSRLLDHIALFKDLPEVEYGRFLVNLGFELGPADSVASEAELAFFKEEIAPKFSEWVKKPPNPKEAREAYYDIHVGGHERHIKASFTVMDLAMQPVRLLDVVFIVLGFGAAVAVVELVTDRARRAKEAADRKAKQTAERRPLPKMAAAKAAAPKS